MTKIQSHSIPTPNLLQVNDPAGSFVPAKNYALQPLPQAFQDMEATLYPLLRQHPAISVFDLTAFYSRRRSDITSDDEISLAEQNQAAYEGAISRGGLVVYYQGQLLDPHTQARPSPALELSFVPDCLSFCIWESRPQALAGANVAAHRQAAGKVSQWYTNFAIKKFTITTNSFSKNVRPGFTEIIFQEY